VSAGNEGGESVGEVVDAVKTLAGDLGVPIAPQAAGVLGETGKFIYAQIQTMEAEKDLVASLVAAGPAIVRLQDVLDLQIDEAEATFIVAHGVSRSVLEGKYGPLYVRYEELKTRERATLVSLATTAPAARAPLEAQLVQLQKLREAFDGPAEEFETRDAALKTREATARRLFAATRRATHGLGLAHLSMAEALAQRRPVSVASLSGAVEEVRALIEDWKAL
jgi:hypothetical protein